MHITPGLHIWLLLCTACNGRPNLLLRQAWAPVVGMPTRWRLLSGRSRWRSEAPLWAVGAHAAWWSAASRPSCLGLIDACGCETSPLQDGTAHDREGFHERPSTVALLDPASDHLILAVQWCSSLLDGAACSCPVWKLWTSRPPTESIEHRGLGELLRTEQSPFVGIQCSDEGGRSEPAS